MSMTSLHRWGRGWLAVAFHRAGGMLENGSAGIPFHVVRQVRRRRARPQHVAPRRGAHSRIGRGAPIRRWGNTRARGGGASSGAMAGHAVEERRRDELGAASGGAGARGRGGVGARGVGQSRCSGRRSEQHWVRVGRRWRSVASTGRAVMSREAVLRPISGLTEGGGSDVRNRSLSGSM
jgi:hypothetical protein